MQYVLQPNRSSAKFGPKDGSAFQGGAWFDGNLVKARDALLLRALTAAMDDLRQRDDSGAGSRPWGRLHTTTFLHPLAVTDAARRRFGIEPFARGGYANTLLSTTGQALEATVGAGNYDYMVHV